MQKITHRPIKFKLLLEGLVTPFSEITVTDAVNVTGSATITIPFAMQGKYIRPKTSVAIFFKYEDVEDMPYNLFFTGEVVGKSVIKRKAARAIQLQCLSLSNYLDHNYISFTGISELGQTLNFGSASGGALAIYNNFTTSDAFNQILDKSVQEYIQSILDLLWKSKSAPDVFLSRFAANKMSTRFKTLPTDMVAEFINGLSQPTSTLKQQLLSALNPFATYSEHLTAVKSLLLMDYVENRSIVENNFLFKPILTYGIPPKCNVIFPCHYENFTFSEDFFRAPTRLFYTVGSAAVESQSGENKEIKLMGLSPYELKEGFIQAQKQKSHSLYFTAEEAERGVIPYIGPEQDLDNSWFLALRAHVDPSGKTNDNYEVKLQQWQDLKLFYLKSRFQKLDLSECVFMPYLMCGFPAAVLDPQGFYTGYLETVVHTISAEGRASTRMNITSAREIIDPVPGRPWWFKDFMGEESSYGVKNVDSAVYEPNLGCKSILLEEDQISKFQENLSDEQKLLFQESMIGALHPQDITNNWRDLCNNQMVKSTVFEDTRKLQLRMYQSLLCSFLEYQSTDAKYLFAENYCFRPASSLQDFVKAFTSCGVSVAEANIPAFEAGEIVDLESERVTVDIPGEIPRTVPVFYFRKINQDVVNAYRSSIGKINIDTNLYGGDNVIYPSAMPAASLQEIRELTTAPYKIESIIPETPKEIIKSWVPGKQDSVADELFSSEPGVYGSLSNFAPGIVPPNGKTCAPMKGGTYRISSTYLKDRGLYKHHGVDLAAKTGTPVYAVKDGQAFHRVQKTGINTGYGRYVEVVHNDGTSTIYAHLSDVNNFKNGQQIGAGSLIGAVGNTGRSSGPHLHFEHKKTGDFGYNRQTYNPMKFIGK